MAAILGGSSTAPRDGKDAVVAHVASLAADHGIRILRGGGTVFVRHGLISPDVAPFVAFLVDPAQLAALIAALRADGWAVRAARSRQLMPPGIVRLSRRGVDGTLNLYGVIPGFFADPAETFAFMWEQRSQMTVGAIEVPILDRLCTVLLAAHDRLDGGRYRRDLAGEHSQYFIDQFRALLGPEERALLQAKVHRFIAVDEYRPLLAGLGIEAEAPSAPSLAYVRARLGLDEVDAGDVWIINRWERPGGRGSSVSPRLAVAAFVRLLGARRRVAAREGL